MESMNIKQEITEAVQKVLKEMGVEEVEVKLEHPAESSHGDYSTNVALVLAGSVKGKALRVKYKNPLELAKDISLRLTLTPLPFIEKVEVAGPGFINFWLSKEYLVSQLHEVLDKLEQYGKGDQLKNKKVMVEYTDPNPFKELHIGHLYSNAVGESLCRLFEAQGAEVKRVNYQGDVGMHVAKVLWALLHSNVTASASEAVSDLPAGKAGIASGSMNPRNDIVKILENQPLKKRIKFLGQTYALGAKAYEDPTSDGEKAKQEIQAINKAVYQKDPSVLELWEKGKAWSLEYFETIYKRLGTKFDDYYFESDAGVMGVDLVRKNITKVFEESEGAIIFPGEKHDLHNRVFINSLGLPTYEAKELGLNKKKYEDYAFDQSIIVTGNEINEYFKVLLAAMEQVIPEVAKKTKHIGHGMVRLPQGKMSSRTGNVLTGEWLLDESKRRISSQFPEMDEKTAEIVAVGAVKYALLKSGIGKDIEFSFDESISFEGNSGPYLQYTYVRTKSVLSKLKTTTQSSKLKNELEIEELALLRLLYRFPEVVEQACEHLAPNYIASFLFELAQAFNLFYQKHKIIESETKEFRLDLTASVGQVLYNGLYLLGIGAPEKM